ncbi:urea carboxylase [Acidobacteria bacterium AB60]|nr:urea carboxylase [Acidobacteria bacterium AB60]
MFKKILVANRGAIASRILRTAKAMGIASVAVYSDADRDARHVLEADEAVNVGPAPPSQSYLSVSNILSAAERTGAQAIHPGYGFLSENVEFARECKRRGVVFIGPRIEHIEAFALKHVARDIALRSGVPMLPGTGVLTDANAALRSAEKLGYPVILKSSAGGGGIGMKVCRSAVGLSSAFESVVRLSRNSFSDGSVYLERYVERAKHVEAQIFGDGTGGVVALGLRDCSAQRRHQKVIEETPVPGIDIETESRIRTSAILLGRSVQYASAGTVEFLYDADSSAFYFLEVNTRLQVEHGVTEQVTGLDLVKLMIQEAAGELPPIQALSVSPRGWSIQARVYAEDPLKNFQPSPGKLTHVAFPAELDARVETWVESGTTVTPFYDPMIAKVIVTGENRDDAMSRLSRALDKTELHGIETNLNYLRSVTASPAFIAGSMTTSFLESFKPGRCAFEVLDGGTQTTIQDFPGRLGYWHVGVPPSGPMDSLAFRIANRLVGNVESAAAVEMTTIGASLRLDADAVFALTGADMGATLDGERVPVWCAIKAKAGSTLRTGAVKGAGARTYLAIQGGVEAPRFLGSRGTFMLGGFGGHGGRALRAGDVVHIAPYRMDAAEPGPLMAFEEAPPAYSPQWSIGVLYGPHGEPEFFTPADIEMLFSTEWRVHHQSDRTGVRLVGPKPEWARKDGGEAGLHPSNIHDNAYAIGSIDFTGDMPILLGPDGPSLGGFVCPAVVVEAERWKIGQLKAGDTVRFHRLTQGQAEVLEDQIETMIATLSGSIPALPEATVNEPAILRSTTNRGTQANYRPDGDKYLLVEYGPPVLDLKLRFRVHLLETRLRAEALRGIIDITPGVRSLQVHYDNRRLRRDDLLDALEAFDAELPERSEIAVPSRTVYLPLSWDDPATQLAQSKYMQSVRPDAPWCPDNIEFIRRINGLQSRDDVHRIVFDASYLVLGLGDVYLGAPVATPLDPRHRLVTTKYNPARTWTPENAVGIGGAYMCIYGMEGPGGYQLVGRTVQVWNTHRVTPTFADGMPWALRFFDQIRFYPVTALELEDFRREILTGIFNPRVDSGAFSMTEYEAFLGSIEPGIEEFKAIQSRAFREERERWAASGPNNPPAALIEMPKPDAAAPFDVPEGCQAIHAPLTASVFQVAAQPGQQVSAGQKLVVLDAMKMELVIAAPSSGIVRELFCKVGQMVIAGQQLMILATS